MSPGLPLALVAAIASARFLAFVARMHIVPFYPELMQVYEVGYGEIGVLFSAFFVGYAAALIPSGWAADRLSPRVLLGAGMLLLSLSTAAHGYAARYGVAIMLRVAQGTGAALVFPSGMKLVAGVIPRAQRGKAASVVEMAIGGSMVITLAIAPWVARWISLAHLFVAMGALGVLGLALLPVVPHRLDGPAFEPVPQARRRIATWDFAVVAGSALLGLGVVNGMLGWVPAYLEAGLGMAKSRAGTVMAVVLAVQIAAALPAGILSDRQGRRIPVIAMGTAVLLAASLGLFFAHDQKGVWLLALLIGAGISWGVTPMTLLIAEMFGSQRAGLATALSTAISQGGSGLVAGLFGWIAEASGTLRTVWILCIILVVLRLGLLLLAREVAAEGRR